MSARRYGKVPIAYWRDNEWTALPADAQWLYEFLLSQSTTDTAGVFPLQVTKWAKGASDMTVERVTLAAKRLAERRRIVVDHDTEEGVLRTYIRDDEAGANIFKGALGCALQAQSASLRAVLLEEILGLGRSFSEKEQELVNALRASIHAEVASQRVATTPSTSTATTTQAFGHPHNTAESLSERRSNGVQQEVDDAAEELCHCRFAKKLPGEDYCECCIRQGTS